MKKKFSVGIVCIAIALMAFVSCDKTNELDIESSEISDQNGSSLKSTSQGSFNVLAYNIAGLFEFVSSSTNPSVNTVLISPRLNNYDIACVQEDWQYHDDLLSAINHPYWSAHAGMMGLGDGLNRVSNYPMKCFEREAWNDCNGWYDAGSDCLTPKGFSFARHYLTDKVTVDIYNVHADAGGSSGDLSARENQFNQLLNSISSWSAGNAVIVLGDMNSKFYDLSPMGVYKLAQAGFSDCWADINNGGVISTTGTEGGIDKIMYRSSDAVTLSLTDFTNEGDNFLDSNGDRLSDHDPRMAEFSYTAINFPQISLKSAHNKYLVAENNGGNDVNANRTNVGPYEKFVLTNPDSDPEIIKSGDIVHLRTGNGYYFSACPGNGHLNADKTAENSWETFKLVNHTDATGHIQTGDIISLQSTASNKYIVAESNGTAFCNRASAGAWEKFTVTIH